MISRDKIYSQLAQLALTDFADIVEATTPIEGKLRIMLGGGRGGLLSTNSARRRTLMMIDSNHAYLVKKPGSGLHEKFDNPEYCCFF